MTTQHRCVFFEDGEPEPVCVCGERAVLVADGDGLHALAPLDQSLPRSRYVAHPAAALPVPA
jgi:hypothetical protein